MWQAAAKRQDAIETEVEDLRVVLAGREDELAKHERDVESLARQLANLVADASGSAVLAKRGSPPTTGFQHFGGSTDA